jgi:hypothetical protein
MIKILINIIKQMKKIEEKVKTTKNFMEYKMKKSESQLMK